MIIRGDARKVLPTFEDGLFDCCVTSPPYFQCRDYDHPDQLGLEQTPALYVKEMADMLEGVKRVLKDDGTLWLNLGDSYDQKTDQLLGIPWRVAFALQDRGWFLQQEIIWAKGFTGEDLKNQGNPIPSSVKNRFISAHEHLFLFSKRSAYFFDLKAVKIGAAASTMKLVGKKNGPTTPLEPSATRKQDALGKGNYTNFNARYVAKPTVNRRDVWFIKVRPYKGAHFATFPEALVEPCILAGSEKGCMVLDPFLGSGTTALVASRLGRLFVGIEVNPDYAALAEARMNKAFGEGGW